MPTSNRCKVATKRCKDNKTKPEEPNNQHNLQIFQSKWETEQHQHYYWILERFELLLQIFSTVSVSASVSHTHNLCMWIRFWVQFAKNSHHISEENGPPPCTCLSVFYSLLSLVPPQGQLSVSAALLLQCSILPNEAAPCCLTLWTSPARLHLWMTDVLFYILLRLSLSHTPTNVTAYAVRVRSLPFTCLLCLICFPSA